MSAPGANPNHALLAPYNAPPVASTAAVACRSRPRLFSIQDPADGRSWPIAGSDDMTEAEADKLNVVLNLSGLFKRAGIAPHAVSAVQVAIDALHSRHGSPVRLRCASH
jgi:hypothetical protein